MKYAVLILLFIVQVLAFTMGLPMCLFISLRSPYSETLLLPCISLFVIGCIAFLINQVLLYLWDKDK